MKVAIVHDYLTQRGGAERVVLSMMKAWPEAPVYTSFYDPDNCFPDFKEAQIHVLGIDRISYLRKKHRFAMPFLAPAFSSLRVDADVVVCSSSGWAHGIKTNGKKIVYCYTPARWLYQTDTYLGPGHALQAAGLKAAVPVLRRWDKSAASRADTYLAISRVVRDRILETYGKEAEILMPANSLGANGIQERVEAVAPPFFMCVSRLLPYKNVGIVAKAFEALPEERLVVVGAGPDSKLLQEAIPRNVQLLGSVSDPELRWLYENSKGLVACAYEDLGLTPLEAASFGKPVAALRWGGYLDTVVEGKTGLFFERPEPDLIAQALRSLMANPLPPGPILEHAAKFSEGIFIERLREVVEANAPS